MADEDTDPKLTAILKADVKDYSRLLSQDRVGTAKMLDAHHKTFTSLVEQYGGRVADTTGDNLLAVFESVSNAVNCSVEIQRELAERNAEVPSARVMAWRIGIELGDIVEEGERIYGDSVNIAARVEGLAEAGGICVSGTVYEQVQGQLGLEYESLGEQEVKNIAKPIRVYRVLSCPGAATHRVVKAKGDVTRKWRIASIAVVAMIAIAVGAMLARNHLLQTGIPPTETAEPGTVPAISGKPFIAVLPFDNWSRDPDQEYFADGMTEEVITRLQMNPMLDVISRNSAFFYKEKSPNIKQIGEKLGVRYVVEGSVSMDGDRIRITAQLIEAATDRHLWAKTYDRELKGIFALQDEIAQEIAVSLVAEHEVAELSRVRRIPTDNLAAYDLFWRGLDHFHKYTKEDNAKAREYFGRAIKLDPGFVEVYAFLGWTYNNENVFGWNVDPRNTEVMYGLASNAIGLDASCAGAHWLMAGVYGHQGKLEQAVAENRRALSLDPNNSDIYISLGSDLVAVGRYNEGIELMERSMRLNPLSRAWTMLHLGGAYNRVGRFDEAIAVFQQATLRDPAFGTSYVALAYTYTEQWRTQQNEDPFVLDKALQMAKKSIGLDENAMLGHMALSVVHTWEKQYDGAIVEAEKATAIAPKSPYGYAQLSQTLGYMGRVEEAAAMAQKAVEIAPSGNTSLILVYRLTGRFADAVAIADRPPTLETDRFTYPRHIELTILYSEMGRIEEARAVADEVLKLVPDFSVDIYGERVPYKDPAQAEQDMAALRKAGLK